MTGPGSFKPVALQSSWESTIQSRRFLRVVNLKYFRERNQRIRAGAVSSFLEENFVE